MELNETQVKVLMCGVRAFQALWKARYQAHKADLFGDEKSLKVLQDKIAEARAYYGGCERACREAGVMPQLDIFCDWIISKLHRSEGIF